MKLSIEQNAFLKALNHGQSVIEKRTTLPILSNILLETDNTSLKLTSTDLELSVVEVIPAHVEQCGRTTVSAHLLYEIIRKMYEGAPITLELNPENHHLLISSGSSQFRLPCLPAEDFPAINTAELPHSFNIAAKTLRQLIDKTKFAMSNEETRYFLNGIYFHTIEDQYLRAVATDGHRLAQATISIPEGATGMPGVIVSRKTVTELLKILPERQEDNVRISLSANQISFKVGDVFMTSRLIDGKYPSYQDAIPKTNDKLMHVHVKAFSKAIDRVATISTDKFSGIKLFLHEGRLTLSAHNEAAGTAQEEIEVAYQGDQLDIGFNSRYLLDIAQQIEGEEAEVSMADSSTAITIRSVNDNNSLYVLMPMRV